MQNEAIKVSIICLAFNQEKYIESCLQGFIMQKTNFPYEVIINDDCSTDATPEIIRRYAEQYPNIIKPIFQSENQYSKHVNIIGDILMPKAKGEYIAFCEGDDAWTDACKLQLQADFLDHNQEYCACVHNTWLLRCDKNLKKFPMFVHNEDCDLSLASIIKWNCFGYQSSSLMVRREFYLNPPYGYGEYPMAISLAMRGKIRYLNRIMSEYRFRSSQYATRYNVFSREKMVREFQGSARQLQKIANGLALPEKELLEKKVAEYRAGLQALQCVSNEEYARGSRKREWVFDCKLFFRAHFKSAYRLIMLYRSR